MNYKFGDNVRVTNIRNGAPDRTIGMAGTIISVGGCDDYDVAFSDGYTWCYGSEELELITSEEPAAAVDPELNVIAQIVKLLEGLDHDAKERALRYASERFDVDLYL